MIRLAVIDLRRLRKQCEQVFTVVNSPPTIADHPSVPGVYRMANWDWHPVGPHIRDLPVLFENAKRIAEPIGSYVDDEIIPPFVARHSQNISWLQTDLPMWSYLRRELFHRLNFNVAK